MRGSSRCRIRSLHRTVARIVSAAREPSALEIPALTSSLGFRTATVREAAVSLMLRHMAITRMLRTPGRRRRLSRLTTAWDGRSTHRSQTILTTIAPLTASGPASNPRFIRQHLRTWFFLETLVARLPAIKLALHTLDRGLGWRGRPIGAASREGPVSSPFALVL